MNRTAAAHTAPAVHTAALSSAAEPQEQLRRAMQRYVSARATRRSTMWAALDAPQCAARRLLTDARFAFFAVRGSGLFHRPGCPHLQGKEHLQGFSRYGAVRAQGFAPCPCCCPQPQDSLELAIPTDSLRREGEDVPQLLANFCLQQGAVQLARGDVRFLQTASARWRLQPVGAAVLLGRAPAAARRTQPGYRSTGLAFLSWQDALQHIAACEQAEGRRAGSPTAR